VSVAAGRRRDRPPPRLRLAHP